ncbi:DNA replication protein DnaC [Sinobaca qinghaiensis]|uniref:DNA replication protein DnaC n=1 Tax=Sinobaca qinghaiensis TaxID=342944 RepID=A0A419V0E8_9BACL|nr:ATP-binding protein [Sinobaca qinghaiensis]RKD71403.1 DNA replication protein DnaC [Sinobaca qinghaiensis]
MIQASDHLPPAIKDTISDSNIIRRFQCEGCSERVILRRVIMPFGPNKGKRIEVTYGCRCEDIEIGRQVLRNKAKREKEKLFQLFDQNSLINADLKESVFESYVPKNDSQVVAKQSTESYTEHFSLTAPGNLLLTGSYGLGKSHLAVSVLKGVLDQGHTGIFISVPKLLTKLKATYNKNSQYAEDDLLTVLEQADCLVLDDIGAEHGSDHSGSWSTSKVFEIVDSRIGKHTIFTTNLNGRDLQRKIGERNFSRMMQHTQVLTLNGADHRLRQFTTIQNERNE